MADDYSLTDLTNPGTDLRYNRRFSDTNYAVDTGELKVLADSGSPTEASITATTENGLCGLIASYFERAKTERLTHEERWMRQFMNYRGRYQEDTVFRDSEQSRAFVKITKTKVQAAYGQILEVLFQGNKFPLAVEPTETPDGIAEYAHAKPPDQNSPEGASESPVGHELDVYGWEGDGKVLPPGATLPGLLGGLAEQYEGANLQEGPAPDDSSMPQIKPAEMAATKMQKAILDQIDEADGHIWLKKTIFEMCLFGQGVLKGPFTIEKTLHQWMKDETSGKMTYTPKVTSYPGVSYVSIWDFYPDPDAKTMHDCEWTIERHKLSRTAIRALLKRPFFRETPIEKILDVGSKYQEEWWETNLRDTQAIVQPERYEVLEFWGVLDSKLIADHMLEDIPELDELEEVQVNVWVCDGEVLRCVLNPFTPAKIPYHSCPYEEHEYQMWGVGVAENMEDSQEIMNAFARLAIDNAAVASNLVFDIDESSLVPGQDLKVHPGKIFRRQAGQPGQAVFGLKFPNTFQEAMNVFDRFRQIADESTGIPSYSHGQTGVTSTTRTSSGLSMLMGAAALNIKTVIKNIDDCIIQPLGEGFFHWNMQFNEDETIKGDLCIKARGTSGLMAREIKSQRLMQFLQLVSNPMLAPFAKFEHIVKEIAETLELDPDDVTNDLAEAAIYAQIIQAAGGMGATGSGSPPNMDASGVGGGNIGQGQVPTPGEQGFTGTPQPQGGGANANSANV